MQTLTSQTREVGSASQNIIQLNAWIGIGDASIQQVGCDQAFFWFLFGAPISLSLSLSLLFWGLYMDPAVFLDTGTSGRIETLVLTHARRDLFFEEGGLLPA